VLLKYRVLFKSCLEVTERGDKAMSGRQIAVQTTFCSRVSFTKVAYGDRMKKTRSLLSV